MLYKLFTVINNYYKPTTQ